MHVYEPRYLQMFDDLLEKAGGQVSAVRFGHVLSPQAAPRALLAEGGAVQGYPKVGVLAAVTAMQRQPDGTLDVQYEGSRRIQLVSLWQHQPYVVGAACWLCDSVAPSQEAQVAQLESSLHRALLEVARLRQRVSAQEGGRTMPTLPEAITRYAPPPRAARPRTIAEHLQAEGHPAGNRIAMWQRHGSVYGSSGGDGPQAAQDPYQFVGEAVGGDLRQELFSFAAACVLELGQAEALALLTSTDRAARLEWVLAAVEPYLQEQRARASMTQVLQDAA